ncbi:hypothetical protein L2E80_14700 [Planktothrix agardhii 1812]|nr:hypothetical protein [Planktothrix agardhii 1812]
MGIFDILILILLGVERSPFLKERSLRSFRLLRLFGKIANICDLNLQN